jgi:hypothetical protein
MIGKPIFTGIATVLALAFTAGLAYGAGRLVSTRNDANQAGQQGARVVAMQPGFQGLNGAMFRHQTRQWMRDQFPSLRGRMNFAANHGTAWGRNCDRGRCMNHAASYRGNGYQHSPGYHGGSPSYSGGGYQHHSGYREGDHRGSCGGGNHGGWGSGNHGGCCGW